MSQGCFHRWLCVTLQIVVAAAAIDAAQVPGLPEALPQSPTREEVVLNGMWDIHQDGVGWTTVQVPGSWGVFHNYKWFDYPLTVDKPATYARSLEVPSSMQGKVVRFAVGASFFETTVKVNNHEVGTWTDGFMPFEFVISPHLTFSSDSLKVEIGDTAIMPYGGCAYARFHRGMWQDVFLKAYPMVFVENDFFVKTSFRNKEISCDIPVKNLSGESRSFYVRNFVTDHSGAVVLTFDVDGMKALGAGDSTVFSCSQSWPNPRMWFPYDPYRYTIHTVLYGEDKSTVIDWKKTRFGFKEFYRDGNQLRLNGVKTKLRGDSHHYFGEYQQTREYAEALFTAFQDWGVNYFRPHTLPYDPVLLEVADSMGMMIVAESGFYGSCQENGGSPRSHIRYWVERDRNHPSVIMWSCGNEYNIVGGNDEASVALAQQLDPTRIAYTNQHFRCWDEVCSNHYQWKTDPNGDDGSWGFGRCLSGSWVPKFGDPDKPHMMEEFGGEWNQSCFFGEQFRGPIGYEYACQDHAAYEWQYGLEYRSKTLGVQKADYAGYCSWSIYAFALRAQPFFNNAEAHTLTWPDLTAPGAKPANVFSGCHTINWCDPSLPIYDPQPNFHLYAELYQPVRCSDWLIDTTGVDAPDINFYEGEQIQSTFDLAYEVLRPANSVRCEIVRRSDNTVLASNDITGSPLNNLTPGNTCENVTVSWTAPNVDVQTPVLIRRVFLKDGQPVHAVSKEGNIFPQFSAADHVKGLSGKKVALYDPSGKTAAILEKLGVTYTSVENLAGVYSPDTEVLIIGDGASGYTGLCQDFFLLGGRALVLRQSSSPSLPLTVPELESGGPADVQYLLHSARHAVLQGLNQNDLSHWRGNRAVAADPYKRPTRGGNVRVLLAADNDGRYAPLLEIPDGKGTCLLSQFSLVENFDEEPVAGQLLCNMLDYLGGYTPAEKSKTGLVAGDGDMKSYYNGLGLYYQPLDAGALPDLNDYTVLVVDGGNADIASSLSSEPARTKLRSFVDGGGKVMVGGINGSTVGSYSQLLPQSVQLSSPPDRKHCIKSAISWRRATTTNEPVRCGNINIPPSWEPNPDPLLLGINNKDLAWSNDIIDQGVVPSKLDGTVNILIAPRKPMLENMPGDRTEHGKQHARCRYQNDWYAERTPALLKFEQGEGCWVVNQLLLHNDSERGTRLGSLLLTSLGASIGGFDTYYNLDYAVPPREINTNPTRDAFSHRPVASRLRQVVVRTTGRMVAVPSEFRGGASVVTVYDIAGKVRGRIAFDDNTPALIDCRRRLGIARGFHIVKVEVKH